MSRKPPRTSSSGLPIQGPSTVKPVTGGSPRRSRVTPDRRALLEKRGDAFDGVFRLHERVEVVPLELGQQVVHLVPRRRAGGPGGAPQRGGRARRDVGV